MNNKKLWMMYITGIAFVILLVAFLGSVFIFESANGSLDIFSMIIMIIPLALIILVLIMVLKKQTKSMKSGLPLKDEMTQKAEGLAGKYTTLVTTWSLLGLMWYNLFMVDMFNFPELSGNYLILGIVIFMSVLFAGLRRYFGSKGNL